MENYEILSIFQLREELSRPTKKAAIRKRRPKRVLGSEEWKQLKGQLAFQLFWRKIG